jgi:hypothetical protein
LTITTSTIGANHVVVSSQGASATGDGGGIRSDTATTIKRSTTNGNTILSSTAVENAAAAHGGGLHLGGPVVHHVTNSTVTGNAARAVTPVGAGSATSSLGGGVYTDSDLSILNATIARNAVRGSGGGTRTVSGGGIGVGAGMVTLRASILARNTSTGTGPDCPGGTISAGHNLIEHVSGCAAPSPTDVVGKDPKLGTLADNGGPTKTLALLAGSPARNRIGTAACAVNTDQRGVHRPQGPKCDIGAFEAKV